MAKYVFPLDPGLVEYIFAPLFDYEHASAITIEIDPSSTAVVSRETEWCYTKIVWHGARVGKTAVMGRCFAPFDMHTHDHLLIAFTLAPQATIEFALLAGDGRILGNWSEPHTGTGVRQEISLPMDRLLANIRSPRALGRLLRLLPRSFGGVAFRISSSATDAGVLALTWFGLRDAAAYGLLRSHTQSPPDWSPWMLDKSAWCEMAPQYGLLFGKDDLRGLRVKKDLPAWKEHYALLEDKAKQYMGRAPEDDFGTYLPNHDLRFARVRGAPTTAWHWEAMVLAFVGLVNGDDKMISHAVRYLMCMIHTKHWADSAEQRIPSSTWNQRSFMEEMTTTSVAILIDWLGFALTPQAKSLARQALWTRGMAHVQRDLFQFDYMHTMNQGAVFCRALILGGLTLERDWPRAKHVADDAYRTMKTVLRAYIKADGGISEGPGYLCQTLTAGLWAIIAYSRTRELDWRKEVQELFGTVESYVRVMAAGKSGQCIPSGDCRLEWFSGDAIPILASVFPDSAYADMLMNCLQGGWVHEITGTLKGSGGMIGMVYGPENVRPSRYIPAVSAWLPESGKYSRTDDVDGCRIRLWVTANPYGASHSHLDHGGFVIEINETPVFIDRGMADYWKAELVHLMKRSFSHNVLTPISPDGDYADQTMPGEAFLSSQEGRETGALLHIPSQEVWPDLMVVYQRIFERVAGEKLGFGVRDVGELRQKGPVAFHLHTRHEFHLRGNSVEAAIDGVVCAVHFPWARKVTVSKSIPDFAGRDVFHICAVSQDVMGFDLRTSISFRPVTDASRDVDVKA